MVFSPAKLEVCAGAGESITTTVSVTPEPQGPSLYAFIVQDQPILNPSWVTLMRQGPGTFKVGLLTSQTLPIGKHDGSITVRLCRDAQCVDEIPLTGNVLPYSIHAPSPPVLTVDGVTGLFGVNGKTGTGKPVVITSELPVLWTYRNFTTFDIISSTPTRLEVVMDTAFNVAGWITPTPVSKCGFGGALVFN